MYFHPDGGDVVMRTYQIDVRLQLFSALQTTFDLCIPKKDLAKHQSQISTKFLQSEL